VNATTTWLAILAVGAVTFLTRSSFIVFADPRRFPEAFRRALAFVPPAVVAAITAPGLFMPEGTLDLSTDNPRWIAGLVALAVAARLRNAVACLTAGMATLWLLQWALR
jgi:branched-subunit amino acid transport protein